MNDRYLYKAKRIDTGEWVEGFLAMHTFIPAEESGKETYIGTVIEKVPERIYDCESYEVDPSTICQCTGLKDKNGKLIWENDILNRCNIVVKWKEELASYCLTKKGWMYQHFFGEAVDACDCEVVGNIFDNPELLEVGE